MNWRKQFKTAAVQPPNSFAPNRFEYIYTQLFVAANIRYIYKHNHKHTHMPSFKSTSTCYLMLALHILHCLADFQRVNSSIFSISKSFPIVAVVVVVVNVVVGSRNGWLVLHVSALEKGITHYYALEEFSN